MAQKKFTALPAADPVDGSEIAAIVQAGVSKRITLQEIADFGGGSVQIVDVDTSPATFAFDFELSEDRIFNCTPAFGGVTKEINLENFANAKRFTFMFELSGGAVLDFTAIGSGFMMNDVRWNLGPDLWIEPGDGKFLGKATYDGTDWWVEISGGPYVKT